jgi:hypothetical protein
MECSSLALRTLVRILALLLSCKTFLRSFLCRCQARPLNTRERVSFTYAPRLQIAARMAAGLLKSGQLAGFKPNGRAWATTEAALQEYIESATCGAATKAAGQECVVPRL